MKHDSVTLVCIAAAALAFAGERARAPESAPSDEPPGPYSAQRDDPWNRVHRAIFHRRDEHGVLHGATELEPLLASHSTWLLETNRAKELENALDSALARSDRVGELAPERRVVLQRDLWVVHDWLVAAARPADESSAAAKLLTRTVQLMRAVALAPEELAAANKALRTSASAIGDPTVRALLAPTEADGGAWVTLIEPAQRDAPLAQSHAAHFGARSAFSVHLHLSAGRDAGERYLERLRAGPTTMMVDGELRLAPDLPQPPPGTHVALVRHALHVDRAGALHVTGCIESVQLRRFARVDVPATFPEQMSRYEAATWQPYQEAREFVLDRTALGTGRFALRELGRDEPAFSTFTSHGEDPLDPGYVAHLRPKLESCTFCHGAVGAHSIVALTGLLSGPGSHLDRGIAAPPRRLAPDAEESWKSSALAAARARPEVVALLASWRDDAARER